jgi:hypothetical protein
MTDDQQEHVLFNLRETSAALNEALSRLRRCVYAMELADMTVNQLLDEENVVGYSIMGDMAAIKAVKRDVDFLTKQVKGKHDEINSTAEAAERVRRYNREMDERNRAVRENVEKPWLPLHDGE